MKALLTLGLTLAAWLPGGLLAAEAATTARQYGGIFVEQFSYSNGAAVCTDVYINPANIVWAKPSARHVSDRTQHGPFGASCEQAAGVEGVVLRIGVERGSSFDELEYLYNGTLAEFRREWFDAHP